MAKYTFKCKACDEEFIVKCDYEEKWESKCPKCGTVYDLDTGFPKSGKGRKRLKTYNVYTTNTTTGISLTVRN